MALALLFAIPRPSAAETFDILLPIDAYGWLDQYSLGSLYDGTEACAPTSSTNAMTFLQNTYPAYFPNFALTGADYAAWLATDELLTGTDYMSTSPSSGTSEPNFISGIHKYITQTAGFGDVQFAGVYDTTKWGQDTPPAFITNGAPTADFIKQSLLLGGAFIANLHYESGGGHVIAVNGIQWDTLTQTGYLHFVDPLDPTYYDVSGQPIGPTARQTTATLSMAGDELQITYDQYHGALPYDADDYHPTTALIHGGVAITVPEPSALLLLGLGTLVVIASCRRRHRASAGTCALGDTTCPCSPIPSEFSTRCPGPCPTQQLERVK